MPIDTQLQQKIRELIDNTNCNGPNRDTNNPDKQSQSCIVRAKYLEECHM